MIMKDAKQFRDLVEFLATQHVDVRHSDTSTHFACTLDDADNKYACDMHYPCVALDLGDMEITTAPDVSRNIIIMFLDHVSDTGSEREKQAAFDRTADIAVEFLAQLCHIADHHPELRFLSRIDINGTDLVRVELEDAGLYGWMARFSHTFSLSPALCQPRFDPQFERNLLRFIARG